MAPPDTCVPTPHLPTSHPFVQEGMTMNYTVRNLLVAAMLMLLGVLAVTSFIRNERQQLSEGKQEVQVFVAAKDIPAGTSAAELETGGYLDSKNIVREYMPDGAIGKMSSIDKLVSNEVVYKGEVITTRAFDDSAGLAPTHQIKGNERLYAVPIPAANDAAGLIKPGDSVDISAGIKGITIVVARDVEIVETPDSLRPKGVEGAEEAPSANGDTKLYVLKTNDREWMNIKFALANADSAGLMLALRPSNGATESKIAPIVPQLKFEEKAPSGSQPGPDPDVR